MYQIYFSVIIPAYNGELYIKRAIDSVLHQTLKDFEIIVIDDGSQDKTSVIVDEYQDIQLIKQNNSGVSVARNTGVSKAIGKWIAFLDADDMWFPNHLSELKNIIEFDKSAKMVATRYIEANTNDNIILPKQVCPLIKKIDYFKEAAENIGVVWSSAVALERNTFIKIGGFEDYLIGEDLRCWARMALEGGVSVSELVTAVYFRGTGGVMEASFGKDLHQIGGSNKINPSISDVSPTCDFLIKNIDNYPNKSKSIKIYINSRICKVVKYNIYIGSIYNAKAYAKLIVRPKDLNAQLIKSIYYIPCIFFNRNIIRCVISFKNSIYNY